MTTHEKSARHIVPASPQALATRSAALITRGLRDLSRDSNWLVKKIFTGRSPYLAVSPGGQICAVSSSVRRGSETIALYDVELRAPSLALAVPGAPVFSARENPNGNADYGQGRTAAFAWSPSARHLIAAWRGWRPELYAFDVNGKTLVATFGGYEGVPWLAWSESENFFADSSIGAGAHLRLWEAATNVSSGIQISAQPCGELTIRECAAWPEWRRSLPAENAGSIGELGAEPDADPADDDVPARFGRAAFSPDEGSLACVVEIEGEWADDSIAILEVPSLRKQNVFHAQGQITDLAWTYDSRQIVFCAAGQANRLAADTMRPEPLPFGAELCTCHPHLPVCLCFSSWLKNSAKGRLFLADLKRIKIFDEYPAEEVTDLRWSPDGSRAYAVTSDGLAYIYEPPLL